MAGLVSAMIDVSDGLVADFEHIAKALGRDKTALRTHLLQHRVRSDRCAVKHLRHVIGLKTRLLKDALDTG